MTLKQRQRRGQGAPRQFLPDGLAAPVGMLLLQAAAAQGPRGQAQLEGQHEPDCRPEAAQYGELHGGRGRVSIRQGNLRQEG